MQINATPSFVTLGEAMALFIAKTAEPLSDVEEFTRSLAGAEVNVAIGMARLGFPTTYISKVGQDCLGQFIKKAIEKEQIGSDGISESTEHSTGFMMKTKQTDGSDPAVEYFRRNSAASTLSATDIEPGLFNSSSHLHLTGVAAAVSSSMREAVQQALTLAKEQGCSISFDTNLRPSLWPDTATMVSTINQLAFASDIVLPGVEEGKILVGSEDPETIADFYLQQGVTTVIVKLGGEGAYYKTSTGESATVAGFPVKEVVDTVGAGDSFAVGVISALLDGESISQATRRGNLFGSLAVQVRGDSEGLPTRAQFNALV
ncbi:sugar kinase [Marinomonas pollencensis]|uniref:2-dehydro-3-deoxygluconokinase n=1 Tax=Marinomonas pollencensis TaxID=491954 RepID=A0A3E0DGU0_9GAMM|nr:sugar kinase [Marinomonas pollencensis]REG81305.1 2-dehydro-3-deoxygluconokinase [Marinomonas pollencensis]